ncbi:MAG: hypothetical protein K5686_03445 [Lachnospiraceae bacterium]|nr:hypothetical protein [Lachnospiraceae bacterium]
MNEIEIREATSADVSSILAYMKTVGGETDNLTCGAEGWRDNAEDCSNSCS